MPSNPNLKLTVPGQWYQGNSHISVAAGAQFQYQNLSDHKVYATQSPTQPADGLSVTGWEVVEPLQTRQTRAGGDLWWFMTDNTSVELQLVEV